jgi:hypothetical protein
MRVTNGIHLACSLPLTVTTVNSGPNLKAGNPNIIVSVSQNDGGANCPGLPNNHCYCDTPTERAVILAEGSPAGPLLRAINAIATAVEPLYPGAVIETLAYEYTVLPPKLTRPRPNVVVTFCTAGTSMGSSLVDAHALPLTDPLNSPMRDALKAWAAIMPSQPEHRSPPHAHASTRVRATTPYTAVAGLRVWDYVENFDNYLMPFPNWKTVGTNLAYLVVCAFDRNLHSRMPFVRF